MASNLNFTSSLSLEGGSSAYWFRVCVCVVLCLMTVCLAWVGVFKEWVHVPTLHGCAESYLSQEWQPPVGEKKAGDVVEAREAAAASRNRGGEGSVVY